MPSQHKEELRDAKILQKCKEYTLKNGARPNVSWWLSILDQELEKQREELHQQKYYELALQAQAMETFIEKDAEEYGEEPIHGKFRAFLKKYIEPSLKTNK